MGVFNARITISKTLNSLFFCLLFTLSSLASADEINDKDSVTNKKERLSKPSNTDSHTNNITTAIRHHYTPPITFGRGPVNATIRLDDTGNVIAVSATGSSEPINQAVMSAIHKASPLPIDLENPNDYAHIVIRFRIPKPAL